MSGAIKNAGDFLIEQRSIALIKQSYPEAEIMVYHRNLPMNDLLQDINQCRFIVMAGGPFFQENTYPTAVPLVEELSEIVPPIYSLGLGWKGHYEAEIYTTYKFGRKMKELISRMEEKAPISCRDWYTMRVLKENGYQNCIMTGCPAWYCLGKLNGEQEKENYKDVICISDAAYSKNLPYVIDLVEVIRKQYTQSSIVYVIHRDKKGDSNIEREHNKLLEYVETELQERGVEIVCIANSEEGFSIYNNCKLHIGFRVHAHIYNLSRGNRSILINEDARGMGVNHALGIENIEIPTISVIAENRTKRLRIGMMPKEQHFLFQKKVSYYLEMNELAGEFIYKRAWESIEYYYKAMDGYIKSWDNNK